MSKPKIPILSNKDKDQLKAWARGHRERDASYRIVPTVGESIKQGGPNFKTLDLCVDRGEGLESYFTGEYSVEECSRRIDKLSFHLSVTPELFLAILGETDEVAVSSFFTLVTNDGKTRKFDSLEETWVTIVDLPKGVLYEVYNDKNVKDWAFAPGNEPKDIVDVRKKASAPKKKAKYNVSINCQPPVPFETEKAARDFIGQQAFGVAHLVTDEKGRVREEFVMF